MRARAWALAGAIAVSLVLTAQCSPFGSEPTASETDDGAPSDSPTSTETSVSTDGGNAPGCPTNTRGASLARVGDVCIDSWEVTLDEYQDFLADPVLAPPIVQLLGVCSHAVPSKGGSAGCGGVGPTIRPELPVVCIDICDARAYCAWAGKHLCGKIGGGPLLRTEARDPTKSEWTYVCTSAGTMVTPGGAKPPPGCNLAKPPDNVPREHAPGQCEGPPGVLDLAGNVAEWIDACDGGQCASAGESFYFRFNGTNPGDCVKQDDDDLANARFGDLGIRCCATPLP